MAAGEVDLLSYLARAALGLALMAAAAAALVKFAKGKGWAKRDEVHVKIIASLPLGKDVFFVLRCGPDVFALTSGHSGTRVIGRWKYEEWHQMEEKDGEQKAAVSG